MKNRNVPFGYGYKDGILIVQLKESEIVAEIYTKYLSGNSLLVIAENLNKRSIEYREGVVGWNKARIKRILEDERYLGKRGFPALVDEKTQRTIQEMIVANSLVKDCDWNADIFRVNELVKCANCHSKMRRRRDSRHKGKVKWICENRDCRWIIAKDDENILKDITDILAVIIGSPEKLEGAVQTVAEPSVELQTLDNEIERMLNSTTTDPNLLRKKIFESASQTYNEIDSAICKTQKIKEIFEKTAPWKNFPAELFDRVVKEIILYKNGRVEIVLINNQFVSKES